MVNGRVSDISTSGLRVQAPIELTAGDKVTLRVTLPGPVDRAEMVAVNGRVVRSDMGALSPSHSSTRHFLVNLPPLRRCARPPARITQA